MKILKLTLLLSLFTATYICFSGCAKVHQDENPIPWSRPADWENKAPGMPNM